MRLSSLLILRLLVSALIATTALSSAAQELRAIAEDGRKVILSSDGRWRFDTSAPRAPGTAAGDGASPYQTKVRKFSVAYDMGAWAPVAQREGEEVTRRSFRHKTLPLHAVVLADEFPVSTTGVRSIILSNMRNAGATPFVLREQESLIDGKTVGNIRVAAAMSGVDFVYSGTYYGDNDGNVQVMCFTAQQLFHKHAAECEAFTAGLRIQ